MVKALAVAALLLALVLGGFIWMGHSVTELSGRSGARVVVTGSGPEAGEALFWGKGRCHTCHSVGDRGSAVRGPNLGRFGEKFPEPIGLRAQARAEERSKTTGRSYNTIDYLVETLARPGDHLVAGYKDEMAVVYAPPVALNLEEIKAIVAYMVTLGGDYDAAAIESPGEVALEDFARVSVAGEAGGGDPGAGALIFEENCQECHAVAGEGGVIGPDLAGIGSRGREGLSKAILEPASSIAKGFEVWAATDHQGVRTVGLKTNETATDVILTSKTGEQITIAKESLKSVEPEAGVTLMPEDFNEALTVKDFRDLLAYLLLLKEKP